MRLNSSSEWGGGVRDRRYETLFGLWQAMAERKDAIGFLIDGFPRNQDNLDGWTRAMTNKVNINFVLYIKAPMDLCVRRCLNRGQGRTDDNEVDGFSVEKYKCKFLFDRKQCRNE